jgi:hypothetical protein
LNCRIFGVIKTNGFTSQKFMTLIARTTLVVLLRKVIGYLKVKASGKRNMTTSAFPGHLYVKLGRRAILGESRTLHGTTRVAVIQN